MKIFTLLFNHCRWLTPKFWDYPELLENKGYVAAMEISDVLLLSGPINTSGDYKRNKHIKLRPAKLKELHGDRTLIWVDRRNEKIGFAANYYCQVFDAAEIKALVIQNIKPAKGPGGGSLEISFADERYNYAVLTGNTHVFDGYQMLIQKLTGNLYFASVFTAFGKGEEYAADADNTITVNSTTPPPTADNTNPIGVMMRDTSIVAADSLVAPDSI